MTIKFCKKCQRETERIASSNNRCKPCNDKTNNVYRLANREKLKARVAAWREANPDKVKASRAAWLKANKDKIKAYAKDKAEKFALYEAFYLANNPKT